MAEIRLLYRDRHKGWQPLEAANRSAPIQLTDEEFHQLAREGGKLKWRWLGPGEVEVVGINVHSDLFDLKLPIEYRLYTVAHQELDVQLDKGWIK